MANYYINAQVKVDSSTIQAQLNKIKTQNIKVNVTSTSAKTATSNINSLNKATKNASKSILALGGDFKNTFLKVLKFGAITSIIGGFTTAIVSAVSAVKEFDDAITDFRKVSNLSQAELEDYTDTLTKFGKEVGRSVTEMVEASTEFKKSGYTEEESAKLAKIASLYQNTADEVLTASEATSVIISQMKAFNITANDSIKIIDSINQVSADFAVSSSDIGQGLTAAGAALSTYGNSFDETVGLLTAGTEIFQGKAQQVARGLNTISARISKNGDALAEYGVDINDTNGDLRSTYDILKDLAPKWETMTNAQKVALGQTLAGTNQYKIFSAVMGNFDTAIKATNDSMNSLGATEKQNTVYMESMTAKLNQLKAEATTLILGDGGLNSLLKALIDTGTAILKFANSDLGQTTIKAVALIGIMTLTIKVFKSLSVLITGKIIPAIQEYIAYQIVLATNNGIMVTSTEALIGGFQALTTAMLSNPMFWGATAIVGITLLITAINKYNNRLSDSIDKLKELKEVSDQSISELELLEGQLIEIQNRISEINKNNLSITDQEQLDLLIEEEASLRRQIALAKQKAEIDNKAESDQAKKALNTKSTSVYQEVIGTYSYQGTSFDIYSNELKTTQEELDLTTEKYKEITEQIQKYNKESASLLDVNGNVIEGNETLFAQLENQISGLEKLQEERLSYGNELSESLNTMTNSAYGYSEAIEKEEANNLASIDSWLNVSGAIEEVVDTTNEAISEIEDTIISFDSLNEALDELQSNYNSLTSVVEEYNSTGKLSFDSIQKLLSLDQEYLSMLKMENGQIVLNTEAIKEKMKVEIEASKESLRATLLANYAEASSQDVKDELLDTYRAQIKLLDALTDSLDATTESTSDLTDELKEQKSVLEDTISNYKDVFSYLKNVVNEEIDSLKSQRDSEVEAIENIQDASEELYDTEVKNIKALIKELEEKQQLEEDTYDSKIESLNTLSDYYDNEINKLRDVNDEISEQIKLQEYQEALAKAKATKVMVLGENGFEYRTDEEAVSKATSDLQSYQNELARNKKIDALQQKKDEVEAQIDYYKELSDTTNDYYDSEIDKLDTYLDDLKEKYEEETSNLDTQIDNIKQSYQALIDEKNLYLDELDKGEKEYETIQSKNLAQVLYGKDFENQTNEERLKNLTAFVANYNAKLSELGNISDAIDNGGIIENESSVGLTDSNSVNVSGLTTGSKVLNMSEVALGGDYGDTSSIIGRPSSILGAVKQYDAFNTTSSNNSSSISIQNLNLDNVTDIDSFISELSTLSGIKTSMTQKAYSYGY